MMETKPGYKTTEFWLTLATVVGTFIASLSDALPPRYAALASTVATGLYAIGRGNAKQGVKPDA